MKSRWGSEKRRQQAMKPEGERSGHRAEVRLRNHQGGRQLGCGMRGEQGLGLCAGGSRGVRVRDAPQARRAAGRRRLQDRPRQEWPARGELLLLGQEITGD